MKIKPSPNPIHSLTGSALLWSLFIVTGISHAEETSDTPPDLTRSSTVERKLTYNLGATGLRGWIYTKPATHFDGLQGRTTLASRQILVTHVGENSPADGVIKVDDVILGAGGKPFGDDARKSIAESIQEAEKEVNKGILKLTVWRAGKPMELIVQLRVMGTYSHTAPYDCPKSKRIFDEACMVLEQEPLKDGIMGSISGLAMLATGNPGYLPKLREFAHRMAPPGLDLQNARNGSTWDLGYQNIFLCEYHLLTGDKEVLHGIHEITLALARGQGMYGTFGHGFSSLTADGKRHGSVPPYGPVNMAGLAANLSIVMGRKCGVNDPEVDAAIARASGFFGYYTDKGAIPYGEHEPWPYHENNGKCSIAALMFSIQGNRDLDARFFASMATAGYRSRECGHTGQGFSYLWSALGANVGGPQAAAAFFKEASWHLDLVRRCNGSFTYDGGEQYGPGRTEDDTYYGRSGYYGMNPTAIYVLTYSIPLKKLLLTGKESAAESWLDGNAVANSIASGRFDTDRKQMNPQQLVAAFRDWSPIVRSWAARELASRPEVKMMEPQLLALTTGTDIHSSQAACETLGEIKSVAAIPILIRLLSHEDRWLRFKAAQAIGKMGNLAKPFIPEIMQALVLSEEPIEPVNWADPIQLTHGQLAEALFEGTLAGSLKSAGPMLLYTAIHVVSQNADGMARGKLRKFFEQHLTLEDMVALAPDMVAAVRTPSPADTMFSNEIRMGAFMALTKYHFKEGIKVGVEFARTQGGHGSETRTGVIMEQIKGYGSAAKDALPDLKTLIDSLNEQCRRGEFPSGELNDRRINAVKGTITAIEAATHHPELRSIPAH